MQPYPHTYEASATGGPAGDVAISSPRVAALSTAPPAQFGGPGDRWSPETLLVASVANCFVLTFRAVARAAGFLWIAAECRVEGVLERVDGETRFTQLVTRVALTVPSSSDEAAARKLLERAEHGCLIGNSLRASRRLEATIVSEPRAAVGA
jgi:organic hydroperoxide reductase OsmC/OhrA